MNTRGLLDQLLKSGQDMIQGRSGAQNSNASTGVAGQLGSLLSGNKGMLAAGALGLLLGSGKARKMGGKVATYGGLAALGVLAYRAYDNWQRQNAGQVEQHEPQTIDRLTGPAVETHSTAILQAIIGAAKADGHIDDNERQMIYAEISRMTDDPALTRWVEQELNKPLDPADIARAAETPEIGAEMYLASLLIIDEKNFMERSYLEELARQMNLTPSLKAELEKQAETALQRPLS